jgi:small subunit ribosomal protein S4e
MHQKRITIAKTWFVPRTGSKYIAFAMSDREKSLPLIVAMRDILKLVKTKKELNLLLNSKQISINGKVVREKNYPINLFDSLSMPSAKKFYRTVLKAKKIGFEEISEKESSERVYKVIGKKILAGKKVQINLSEGKNIISSEKIDTGDFVKIDNSNNKIKGIKQLKEGEDVIITSGKHIGKKGKIKKIIEEGERKIAEIESKNEKIRTEAKNLFITH